MNLNDLGLTKEQVFEAVVNKIAVDMLCLPTTYTDEDGEVCEDVESTPFRRELQKHIADKVDSAIEAIVDKHILPNAEQHINNLILQRTNSWGEKQGDSLTFVEYLTKRAEQFMSEKVDFNGKPKGRDGYSWSARGTRIEFMIDKYLQYHIEAWAKKALKEANKSIVEGLQKAVETKLQEVLNRLKFNVK